MTFESQLRNPTATRDYLNAVHASQETPFLTTMGSARRRVNRTAQEIPMGAGAIPFYDKAYRSGNLFRYRRWLYEPFVRALITKAKLKPGSRVLDIGCGQGFFTRLFADCGLKPLGIDCSADAIRLAEATYGGNDLRFELGDAFSLPYKGTYDCVFARGLSLYNQDLEHTHDVTRALLSYLKPGGTMIFATGTNLGVGTKSDSWFDHSLTEARYYFSAYPGAQVYFSLRIETRVFRSLAFCFPLTLLLSFVSRVTGLGGDLICFLPQSCLATTVGCTNTNSCKPVPAR